jgi:broad specificity phosphatase PhoE
MLNYNEFNLTLIRHGQSTTNANPDLMGQNWDTPLSEKGKLQAEKLGKRLSKTVEGIDFVYSSHYTRAHDTARIALMSVPHTGIVIANDLREYEAGEWTGASRADTLTTDVKNRMGAMGHGFLPPSGESLHQVERRASLWLEENILYSQDIQERARFLRDDRARPLEIYCFSHGMTIKCLLHYVMGFDQSFTWKVTIENTSITRLHFGKDGWRVNCINDHSHLD